MNKNRKAYDRPTTDVLMVRFEGNLLTGSYGEEGAAGAKVVNGGVYDFDDE